MAYSHWWVKAVTSLKWSVIFFAHAVYDALTVQKVALAILLKCPAMSCIRAKRVQCVNRLLLACRHSSCDLNESIIFFLAAVVLRGRRAAMNLKWAVVLMKREEGWETLFTELSLDSRAKSRWQRAVSIDFDRGLPMRRGRHFRPALVLEGCLLMAAGKTNSMLRIEWHQSWGSSSIT